MAGGSWPPDQWGKEAVRGNLGAGVICRGRRSQDSPGKEREE